MTLNPWVLLALVVAWGSSCAVAYYKGGEHRENALIAAQERQRAEDVDRQARIAAIVAGKKKAARQVNRALEDEVFRYVSSDSARADCFDADGLHLFNALAAGVPVPGGGSRALQPATAGREERKPRRDHPGDEAGRRRPP